MSGGARAIRRRFRRSTVRIRVDYETPRGPRSDVATTLGVGGLFVATPDPLPVGTVLQLRFRLEAGPHELTGRVVWCHPFDGSDLGRTCGMGLEFARDGATARLARELSSRGVPDASDREAR